MHRSLFSLVAVASLVSAKKCMNATVPVHISSRQGVFGNTAVPQTDLEAQIFIQNTTLQGRNFTAVALTDYATVSNTYNISAKFCTPDSENSTTPSLQILTHGIGFDKTYWDLSYNNYNYSYIDAATNAGFCTLSYDRLGIGNSSHGEPRDEIQVNLEIEALHQLTLMLQNGTYPGVNQSFTRTIHVGHSFGSAQSYALVNKYPDISDGLVLTGFSMNGSFVASFAAGGNFMQANTNAPVRFGNTNAAQIQQLVAESPLADYLTGVDLSSIPSGQNLPNGYLVSNNAEAIQLQFFQPGYFDPKVLTLADQTKQPVTIGELLTLSSLPMTNNFAGPVMVINGEGDVPYCGGNCSATGLPDVPSLAAAVSKSFPNVDASNFTSYIQPDIAHGINLHYNATGAYSQITQFLLGKGLGPS